MSLGRTWWIPRVTAELHTRRRAPINGATRAFEVQLSGAAASQLVGVRTLASPNSQTFYVGYLVRHHAGAAWAGANNTFTLHLGTNNSSTTTLNFGIRGTRRLGAMSL